MSLREYFIATGDIKVSPIDVNGDPTTWRDIGEVPVVEFNPQVDYADNFSTDKTGPNVRDLHVPIKRTSQLMLTMKERSKQNLEIQLHGESDSEAAGTMSAPFSLQADLEDGDVILLPTDHVGITDLVLKDSAGLPVTLDGDNYTFDGESKLITFIDVE